MGHLAGVGVDITAVGCIGTVSFLNATGGWKGDANRESHELGPRDVDARARYQTYPETQHDTNPGGNAEADADPGAGINADTNPKADTNPNAGTDTNTDSNANAGSYANTDSRAANLQSCVRDRDGERGVDQPDR